MENRTKLIDIRTCDMTLSEVMAYIGRYNNEHPDMETFIDGDTYSVLTEPKRA